jgi:hypothetical protein
VKSAPQVGAGGRVFRDGLQFSFVGYGSGWQ